MSSKRGTEALAIIDVTDIIAYGTGMATSNSLRTSITIRGLDSGLKERLRVRAAKNSRSMEAEARSILAAALPTETGEAVNLAEAIRRRFAPFGGVDLEEHPAVAIGDPPSFDR